MNTQKYIDAEMRTKREVPKNLHNLSVFQYPYKWKSWRGFWKNLIYFFKCLRPAWHRATRGYCGMDTWNADSTICAYLIKVLTEYRNVTNGFPGDNNFPTFESWIACIDEIIDNLIYAQTPLEDLCGWTEMVDTFQYKPRETWTAAQEEAYKNWCKELVEIKDKQEVARMKAFTMLSHNLPHIWW